MSRAVTATAVAVGAAGAVVFRQLQRRAGLNGPVSNAEPSSRWQAVTINKSPEEVMPDRRVPDPLVHLGDLVDVEVRPAPGDKGSELRARLRTPERRRVSSAVKRLSGKDRRAEIRAALREAKQLIEVGEVLRVDPTPHGHRPPTPTGKLVELAARRASGEGVL